MSDELVSKLERFSPTMVDRDAMLIAIGRASVRPARGWKLIAISLLISQTLTLGLWLLPKRDPVPVTVPVAVPAEIPPPPSAPAEAPSSVLDPSSIFSLSMNADFRRPLDDSPSESEPPLTVLSRTFQP